MSSGGIAKISIILLVFRRNYKNFNNFACLQAGIEWKTDSDGSIHVKIRSSPSDLDLIRKILKRSRRFQLPHRNISMSSLVSVLQQSDKLGDEVSFAPCMLICRKVSLLTSGLFLFSGLGVYLYSFIGSYVAL